jgi:zinc protease
MKKLLCHAVMGLWTATIVLPAAAATPGVDAPPPPAAARAIEMPPIAERQLANGMKLIVIERRASPVVTAELVIDAGPEADRPAKAGTAALLASVLTKGAVRDGRRVSATQIAQQAEALGGALEAASTWRATGVGMTVITPNMPAALALIADVVRRPTLSAAEVQRGRDVALDELKVALSSPGDVAAMAAQRVYWGAGSYGASATPTTLKRIAADDVARFHRGWFRPDAATLIVAGDIGADDAVALAQRHFGDWKAPRTALPAIAAFATAPKPGDARTVLIDMPGSGQSAVMVAAAFPASGEQEAQAQRVGEVANAVLGVGYSSRLNQEIRIKRGLSYGATSRVQSHPVGGMLMARVQTKNASAAEVLQLARGEILRLAESPVPPEEFAARKAVLIGNFAEQLDTTAGLAELVLRQRSRGRPVAELARTVADIEAVTADQVRDFARQRWAADHLIGVVAGDLKAAGDGFGGLEGRTLRTSLKALGID